MRTKKNFETSRGEPSLKTFSVEKTMEVTYFRTVKARTAKETRRIARREEERMSQYWINYQWGEELAFDVVEEGSKE